MKQATNGIEARENLGEKVAKKKSSIKEEPSFICVIYN